MQNQPIEIILAEYWPSTHALGPGLRAAIWVQGCALHCPGCIAPEWIPQDSGKLIAVPDLAQRLLSLERLDGLTISGGEPMLQAGSLAALVRLVRAERQINVICYSGYRLEQLQRTPPAAGVGELLAEVDVLIDGPYVSDLNEDRGLRGSRNQVVHYLTDALRGCDLAKGTRSFEIVIQDGNILSIGVPPKGVSQALRNLSALWHP